MKNPIHKTFNTIHLIYNGSRMRWIALIFPVLIFLFIFENVFLFLLSKIFARVESFGTPGTRSNAFLSFANNLPRV